VRETARRRVGAGNCTASRWCGETTESRRCGKLHNVSLVRETARGRAGAGKLYGFALVRETAWGSCWGGKLHGDGVGAGNCTRSRWCGETVRGRDGAGNCKGIGLGRNRTEIGLEREHTQGSGWRGKLHGVVFVRERLQSLYNQTNDMEYHDPDLRSLTHHPRSSKVDILGRLHSG
jgi:hypothetical protein